jgi:AcrR family transcriptional regulator
MGRHKTISDDEVLRVARGVFRSRGHTATTREIADAAGISEAVLYQRYGSKDHLFFAAMHARGPDVEEMLGPADPPGDARKYLHTIVARLAKYFAEVIPLALHMMMHPSFDHSSMARMQTGGPADLKEGLARRLTSLARRGKIDVTNASVTAKLLVSLAHDWALGGVMSHDSPRPRDLKEMIDVVWNGLRPGEPRPLGRG